MAINTLLFSITQNLNPSDCGSLFSPGSALMPHLGTEPGTSPACLLRDTINFLAKFSIKYRAYAHRSGVRPEFERNIKENDEYRILNVEYRSGEAGIANYLSVLILHNSKFIIRYSYFLCPHPGGFLIPPALRVECSFLRDSGLDIGLKGVCLRFYCVFSLKAKKDAQNRF